MYRYRRPKDILISTYVTIQKLLRRKKVVKLAGRTEPFMPFGPYCYVRNPLYFGVLSIIYGIGLVTGSLTILLWSFLLTLWFWFVLIPFEERELAFIFEGSYEDYQRQVPKLLPYGRRFKTED